MSFWSDLKRWWVGGSTDLGEDGRSRTSTPPTLAQSESGGLHSGSHFEPVQVTEAPPVTILTQGPLTDLKRMSRYLASTGIESQLVMPPGGCGT